MILTFVVGFHRMSGNNMYHTMQDGDLGIFYKLGSVMLNDVVMYEDNSGDVRIGRVVAVEGQTVKFLENGGYEVNGYAPLEEIPYETYGDSSKMITLGTDEYYILNDFRSDTKDSRQFGTVSKSDIKGKLVYLFRGRDF